VQTLFSRGRQTHRLPRAAQTLTPPLSQKKLSSLKMYILNSDSNGLTRCKLIATLRSLNISFRRFCSAKVPVRTSLKGYFRIYNFKFSQNFFYPCGALNTAMAIGCDHYFNSATKGAHTTRLWQSYDRWT